MGSSLVRVGAVAVALAGFLLAAPVHGQDESPRRPRLAPRLGFQITPALSVILPAADAEAVSQAYGFTHPAGSVGVSVHPTERFGLVLELEAEGWQGTFEPRSNTTINLRFLSYWIRARARTRVYDRGPFSIHIDGTLAMIVSREDGHEFRSTGQGFGVGVAPVFELRLSRYVGISLSALLELGWCWYSAEGPASPKGDYMMPWPRFLFGLGFHGYLLHRAVDDRPRVTPDQDVADQEPSSGPTPESSWDSEAVLEDGDPAEPPLAQPWDED